ncbi:MAG: hypothetical protein UH211_11260 [Agathobacter sp.]|nr:hypothetical protein [Agathobacter sp.]
MLFNLKNPPRSPGRYLPAVLLFVVILLFAIFSNQMTESNTEHSREILERALSRSITQCYAIEGTYPPSLNYLIEHYGLCYDSDHYYIDYRYIGSNLRPDVTIIERTEHATY